MNTRLGVRWFWPCPGDYVYDSEQAITCAKCKLVYSVTAQLKVMGLCRFTATGELVVYVSC